MVKISSIYDNKGATTGLMFLLGAIIPIVGFILIIIGVILAWTNKTWPMWAKAIITVVTVLWILIMVIFFGFIALLAGSANKSTVYPTNYVPHSVSPAPSINY